jgi:beta-galactosidase
LQLGPGQSTVIEVPFSLPVHNSRAEPSPHSGADYWLKVEFRLRKDEVWAGRGHVVAWQQMAVPYVVAPAPLIFLLNTPPMELTDAGEAVTIHGRSFDVSFDKRTGVMSSLKYGTMQVIEGVQNGPVFNLYRARLDNDRTKERGPGIEWEKAGYDSLTYELKEFKVSPVDGKTVGIAAVTDAVSKSGFRITSVIDAVTRSGFRVSTSMQYTIHGDGAIDVKALFNPGRNDLDIPRLGLRMALCGQLENVQWYGRGPHENYADRKESAAFGDYSRTVTDMMEPYERPQGMGNREDTRWVKLTNADGHGILIVAEEKLNFTALHFTDQDLRKADHLYQLKPRKETILSLDYQQMGIGNASCGPTPLPQYYIADKPAGLSFSIRAYSPEKPF